MTTHAECDLASVLPARLRDLAALQTDIPKLAQDSARMAEVEQAVRSIPTTHVLRRADAREMDFLDDQSVHLVLTSPPYWTLKEYNVSDGQMGYIRDYEEFLEELDKVWSHAYRALVPGGRLVCVVGDVCLSRRQNKGRHTVIPLHASIQEHCRAIGFDNLAPFPCIETEDPSWDPCGATSLVGACYTQDNCGGGTAAACSGVETCGCTVGPTYDTCGETCDYGSCVACSGAATCAAYCTDGITCAATTC